MNNILDIAHKRTRRHVLSCYMSDTTWTKERRPRSRMKRVAMKARSQCSTSEKKRMESRLRTSSKQIVRALHANGRRGRFYRVTCRARHEWERKERQNEWSPLLRWWDHDGSQTRRNKWSSSSKNTWIQWGDLKEDVDIRRVIEERWSTPKAEKQRMKEVSKQIENVSGTRKDRKDRKKFNEYLETSKG